MWGSKQGQPYWLALLPETSTRRNQAEEGWHVLAEALALVDKNGERCWEGKPHRLKGKILLKHAAADEHQAESCFQQTLKIAQYQQAKFLELRVAISLSQLWQRQGRRTEARELLAEVHSWFTVGFAIIDLREARAVLTELS